MATPSYSRDICAIYRLSAIRVCCAFRTVSDNAVLVIASMVPLEDLVADAILSGHGCFRSYLKRFGHANHVLFECGRFLEKRRCLEEALGRSIRADNMVSVMLEAEAAWKLISTFATTIMMELRRIDRRRAVPS
ncbi:uncharacterized protein LOC122756755 [Drosophila mojavensis]|uniref:uncharacterized protein LOC122756755 n=1 Tax=Drosophila mojavensis TaxID=7230 RepID=UPI001CD11BBD|nr:uncharacterized protein LOC122756755 [Drosophila mojavensis]